MGVNRSLGGANPEGINVVLLRLQLVLEREGCYRRARLASLCFLASCLAM